MPKGREAGAGLYAVDFLVVAFFEDVAELRRHLGDALVEQVVQDQVDLALKGFQAGNTAVYGQGVQLGGQKGLDAGIRFLSDPGDIFAQGRLPFLELFPGQKPDGLVIGQAILPGVSAVEAPDLAPDFLRGVVVFLEQSRGQGGAVCVGFFFALDSARGPVRRHSKHPRQGRFPGPGGRSGPAGDCYPPGYRRTDLHQTSPGLPVFPSRSVPVLL